MQVWANNANGNKRRLSNLQMEPCQLVRKVVPRSEFQVWLRLSKKCSGKKSLQLQLNKHCELRPNWQRNLSELLVTVCPSVCPSVCLSRGQSPLCLISSTLSRHPLAFHVAFRTKQPGNQTSAKKRVKGTLREEGEERLRERELLRNQQCRILSIIWQQMRKQKFN